MHHYYPDTDSLSDIKTFYLPKSHDLFNAVGRTQDELPSAITYVIYGY